VTAEAEQTVDITEMPLEGIAAYWLSLKKIMGTKVTAKAAQEEAERTEEPYIKYLLETAFTGLTDEQFRRVCVIRAQTSLDGLRQRLGLMREAHLSMAAGENPRKSLVRMAACFPCQHMPEEKITRMALEMVKKARAGNTHDYLVTVDTRMPADQLLVKLMFYVIWARHEGTSTIEPFAESSRCVFFREGLTLVSDGFDRSFIKTCLDARYDGILHEAERKMAMAAELATALRTRCSYEDMFAVAQAYL
jgi:hypothetical protein